MNKKDIINEYLNNEIELCQNSLNYVRRIEQDTDEDSKEYVEEIRFEAFRRLEILKVLRGDLNDPKQIAKKHRLIGLIEE